MAVMNTSNIDLTSRNLDNCTDCSYSVAGPREMTTQIVLTMKPHSLAHLLATSIVLGTIILSTIIGNVFVIAAVILEKNLHNVANYLISSLAVADLMVASLVMPLAALNEVSAQWFLGNGVCDMFVSFDVLCCTSSILHLVAIALDRYWAVTQVDYIHNRSAKRILLMVALSWGISATISIPPLFGWKNAKDNPNSTGECIISQDWGYTVFSTIGAFYLPLLVMIIIYIKIFRAARRRIRKKHFKHKGMDPAAPRPLLSEPPTEHGTPLNVVPSSLSQSPEPSSNGSAMPLNDANRNNKQYLTVTPPASPLLKQNQIHHKSSWIDLTKEYLKGEGPKKSRDGLSPKRRKTKERLEQKRERKAARTLGIITGSFIFCWLPFFIVAIVRPFCGSSCHYPSPLMSIIGWLGYFNSLLNPIIYTIFNPDFRSAFRKILFGKYHNRRGRGYRNARRR